MQTSSPSAAGTSLRAHPLRPRQQPTSPCRHRCNDEGTQVNVELVGRDDQARAGLLDLPTGSPDGQVITM